MGTIVFPLRDEECGLGKHYIRLNIFFISSIENRITVGLPWGQV